MNIRLTGLKIYNTQTQEFEVRNIDIHEKKYKQAGTAQYEESCDVINLRNHYLYPAIIDSHLHLLGIGVEQNRYNLNHITSAESLKTVIITQDTSFVVLRGWDESHLGFFPDRAFIDSVLPDRKCLLIRKCGHTATCNSLLIEALKQNGIAETDDSDFSRGILKERTLELTMQLIQYSKKDLVHFLAKASDSVKKTGITCVHSDDYHSNHIIDLVDVLKNQKEIRIFEKINPKTIKELNDFIESDVFHANETEYTSIRSVKTFLDGSFGAKSAYLKKPYQGTQNKGVLYMNSDEFAQYVRICEENDLQLLVHIIGDGALDVALDGFQRSITSYNPLRHRIIHIQMASDEQLKRIKEMNLYLSIQPIFYTSDYDMALNILGKERMEQIAYPFKRALDLGIECSLSTDAPVEDYNPFKNMVSATHFFDLKTAFEKYTLASAKAGFMENRLGRIADGYAADGFISDKNIFELNNEQLASFQPKAIIYDGKINHYISD
ncbi:MAG TPA: amidohydrolase family protein [Thermotogota bacterium]|nr:amidohydrolase family protein [Thermotogota bacterium]HRW33802.1 amidohydrolase family protein [Thermotogota bacterium]